MSLQYFHLTTHRGCKIWMGSYFFAQQPSAIVFVKDDWPSVMPDGSIVRRAGRTTFVYGPAFRVIILVAVSTLQISRAPPTVAQCPDSMLFIRFYGLFPRTAHSPRVKRFHRFLVSEKIKIQRWQWLKIMVTSSSGCSSDQSLSNFTISVASFIELTFLSLRLRVVTAPASNAPHFRTFTFIVQMRSKLYVPYFLNFLLLPSKRAVTVYILPHV